MYNDQNRRNGYPGNSRPAVPTVKKKPSLDKLTYVKQAEDVIKDLKTKKVKRNGDLISIPALSTNQIRNILTMTNELYNTVRFCMNSILEDDLCSHIQYTKMKIAYNAGRDDIVKDFVEKSCLMQYLDEVGDSRDKLITFCHYAEALVAYHKFYGGEDK